MVREGSGIRMFKYSLEGLLVGDECKVQMPASATIKAVQMQNSMFGQGVVAWAEVINDDYYQQRVFVAVPTGGEIPYFGEYLATLQLNTGIVCHIYILPADPVVSAKEEVVAMANA